MLLVGLGLPALIGAAGYGTDMAQLYMWKRELQHSVDQAALAGAYALANDPASTKYQTRALQEFNANQKVTADIASTPSVALAKYDGGDDDGNDNSVIVSASAQKRLPFSGFLTDKAMYIHVSAQATFAKGNSYKACLMTLKKDAKATFSVGGSATVHAQCGLGALSCEEGAIDISGSPTIDTDSIATCGTVTLPDDGSQDSLKTKIHDGADLSNPFEDLPAPEPTDTTSRSLNCPTGKHKDDTTYLSPGTYSSLNIQCKVVLSSGIYVIDGGTLDMSDNNAIVTGTNVMFVLKNGATLNLTGQGNGGSINLSPMEAANFVGTANEPYKDLYAGMLVYEDDTGQTSPVSHRVAGNSNISIRGTIYLPNGDVEVTGSSSTNPLCFQIWSSTLTITGNTSLSTTCTSEEANGAGSDPGGVKLVA